MMKSRLSLALLAAFFTFNFAAGQNPAIKDSLLYDGIWRTHYVYVPETLVEQHPLIVMLHGYGGKAEGYRPEMLEAARRAGFAVCIPQGLKAPRGKTGWWVGYPAQEGMRRDDDEYVCHLAREVAAKYGLNPRNLFLTGMSNGGEMCYLIGRKFPSEFNAIASVAGLTMKWVADEVPFRGPVPFMEVHGTADKTSMWEGDIENTGGWGAYIAVPDAVEAWVEENGCTDEETIDLPLLSDDALPVILHHWKGGEAEVLLYEVQGGKHSWHLAHLDTCAAICDFFLRHLN